MSKGFIYLIRSDKNGRSYLGSTCDPNRRIREHNNGVCTATKNGIPWKCELVIALDSPKEARKAEYYIKRYKEKLSTKNVVRILSEYFSK